MTYELKLNLPLSDDHLKAIGRVTANWTMIEYTLERYIWFQVSMGHDVGKCITTNMSYPQRLQAVLTLCHDMFMPYRKEQVEALRKFADRVTKGPYAKRNDIVHATWEPDEKTGAAIIAKRKARIELKEILLPYTVEQIEGVATEIEDAFYELNRLLLELEPEDQIGQKAPSWLDQRHWQKLSNKPSLQKP